RSRRTHRGHGRHHADTPPDRGPHRADRAGARPVSVLLTGAAGFIGSHLTEALLAGGEEVVGLDNFDDFYARPIKEANLAAAREHDGFRRVEGDIRDEALLARLPDVDAIVHLAARAGVRPSIQRPALYADVNLMGTTRLLELART